MPTAHGYAALTQSAPLEPYRFERAAPVNNEVRVDIAYCGVCHSDLHQIRNDWGNSVYPCVPGHEIVGRVAEVGPEAKRFAVGDLVGVGCMINSCRSCASCVSGEENYCEGPNSWLATYNGPMQPAPDNMYGVDNTFGGYSDHLVVREEFLIKMPETLPAEAIAPLLCAGVTTWSPLRHWNVQAGDTVGVIGLGGLGDMAVKLARALGAKVVAFTTSADKEAALREDGADEVVLSTDEESMAALERQIDFMISTIPETHDLDPFVRCLKRDGVIAVVGALAPLKPIQNMQLIMGRRSIAGSLIGSIAETQEVVDFCAERGIVPRVEVIRIQDINEAFERMTHGDVRFRFVIDMTSLRPEVVA